ncbi:MAG: Rieske 2Fe-2S domain-containing protein [Chloroflexi bacterium]|nr:Rieske 2Fe-2S domain-containing protein [Chloroflexota bacterium]
MLTKQDNELLTRVGPATPMGRLFRRFWLPALMPSELPQADCDPVRVRLLGEDLIAFRDTNGKPGFIQNNCPHRGASLFFGRNEEGGLRCVYHGWKFAVDGTCVDMPNEPAESDFKHRVRATAYPGADWGGMIWIYMGPPDLTPSLPELEWCLVPDEHRVLQRWIHETNYAQAAEGDIDTSHISFLHRRAIPGVAGLEAAPDLAPKLMVKETDYGFVYGGRRQAENRTFHWRLTQWMLPFYSIIPGTYPLTGHAYVPIDDEHTSVVGYRYHPERPLSAEEQAQVRNGLLAVPRVDRYTLYPVANRQNDYLIDRQMQKTVNYTGIRGISEQDMAMTQSMGPIYDRSQEHLGTSDVAVIAMRRLLLRLAANLEDGLPGPYAAYHGEAYRIRPLDTRSEDPTLQGILEEYETDLRMPAQETHSFGGGEP